MTSRVPLPLRLVQCDWRGGGVRGSSGSGFRVLTVYKPSGLPCYAASQVRAVAAAGGDGRRLCAIHTRHAVAASHGASPSPLPAVEAGPQPLPDDPSDSLLSRVVDASLPGCTPYIALPVVSQLLRHGGDSGGPSSAPVSAPSAAQRLNQWTIRHKGLVLVTGNPSDALFLRNAAQLDLVQRTYRVSCRLPAGVATAARRYLQAERCGTQPAGSTLAQGRARVVNPYVQAHRERRQREQQGLHGDLSVGIPLACADGAAASLLAVDARVPASVHPHPLISGGFFDIARGQLRVGGTLRCFLRVQAPLAPTSAARVAQRSRLHSLFAMPTASSAAAAPAPAELPTAPPRAPHPWLPASWRLGVSLDAPHMQCESGTSASSRGTGYVPAPRGKAVRLEYRLLSLSPCEGSDVALYEVHARGDTTADEVAAVFAAEGLPVVNDYVQDVEVATAVEEVATRMRVASPPALLHTLPLGLQHRLRTATAEELVALPLTWMPLEDADRLAALQTLRQLSSPSAALASVPTAHAEDVERLRHVVHAASGKSPSTAAAPSTGVARHPLLPLLLHALSTFRLSNAAERAVYERVMALALGSGVECFGCVYPDPALSTNVHALQQLWLTYEQQRQRQPSLADAARAARLHPLASSLQYTTRSALDEPVGVTQVPLLADVAGHARGECSVTQALTLCTSCAAPAFPAASGTDVAARSDVETPKWNGAVALPSVAQTEVPASHEAAYRAWCASTAAAAAASATMLVSGVPSLWPAPSELMGRCTAAADGVGTRSSTEVQQDRETGAAASTWSAAAHQLPETLPVRLLLRAEELADAQCAYCGEEGHTWQHCAHRVAAMTATLPFSSPPRQIAAPRVAEHDDLPSTASGTDGAVLDSRGGTAAAAAAPPPPLQRGDSVTEGEGLFSVEDAAAVLALQASDAAHQRYLKLREDSGASIHDGAHASESLVSMPNVAATQHFKAEHALRRETRKPAVHRRLVRCVYCGGRHHVTACPTLRAQNGETAAQDVGAAGAAMDASGPPLFCIACGQTGHLYARCPQVPAALHHATHCPICRQPRTSSSHSPTQCPQRATVPDGYEPNGVPAVQEAGAAGGSYAARASGGGRGAGLGFGAAATPREPGRRHPRRRKGSVLIADSFVDRK